ncbi:sodium- and chloride-dependent GABA transporter 1 [Caerostris extrusa]|uniref:Sodium- and chloride-dependent GABA transporter 1 n=1 Tax=Caerostris extrusa TaxID=172846 RepID=A0AAV4TED5_CAEEX|nr:sodium- and chloride-dependent GABA transporter 1 [Caerostris extrusa]
MEGFITAVGMSGLSLLRPHKELFIAFVCVVSYIMGLCFVTQGGMYVFQLFDYYAARDLTVVSDIFEVTSISWSYGVNRYYDNLRDMLGLSLAFSGNCVGYFSHHAFVGVSFLFSMVQYKPLDYIGYIYPWWGQTIGWVLGLSSMMCIPVYAAYKYFTTTGTFRERTEASLGSDVTAFQNHRSSLLNFSVIYGGSWHPAQASAVFHACTHFFQ